MFLNDRYPIEKTISVVLGQKARWSWTKEVFVQDQRAL